MRKSYLVLFGLMTLLVGCSKSQSNFVENHSGDISTGDFVNGQIVLDLKDGLSDSDIVEMSKEYGINIHSTSPLAHDLGNLEVADVDPNRENELLNKLSSDARVELAEPSIVFRTSFTPNDPMYKDQWGMVVVGATDAWSYSYGQGVVVAVVDTGIDHTLSDLKSNNFVSGYNFVDGNDRPMDRNAHGSHVSGSISQSTQNGEGCIGVAPNARLMGVKVLSDSGSGTNEQVAAGVMFAVKNGADVINMSLGSSQKSSIVAKSVKYAYEHGVAVFVAAGNDRSPISGSPASDYGAIAISATDENGNLASFASYGKEVKLGSPGTNILQQTVSRDGTGTPIYAKFSGSSMSAPLAAGCGTLLYSQGITSPDAALSILQKTATPKNDPIKYGAGIVNASAAVRYVFFSHLFLRSLFLTLFSGGLFYLLRKEKRTFLLTTPLVCGMLLSSVGLMPFLQPLGVLPYTGSLRPFFELLCRPFGEWDLLVSVGYHKWLPLASALPTMAIVAFGYHKPTTRYLAGGFALGTAALLAQVAYSAEINFVLGTLLMRVWCFINIAACLWVAKNSMVKET